MALLQRLYWRIRRDMAGQTMTEYVLIIAAIAIVGYLAYQGLGSAISTEITTVTGQL
jgi:Flp pilus assembly pilin Flp